METERLTKREEKEIVEFFVGLTLLSIVVMRASETKDVIRRVNVDFNELLRSVTLQSNYPEDRK